MIRTVLIPQKSSFIFAIPTEYIGKEVEVTIVPRGEDVSKSLTQKKVSFDAVSIDTRQYKFSREEANAR